MQNAVLALPAVFTQLGRCGPWRNNTQAGNPCDSVPDKQYLAGYKRLQIEAGRAEKAAIP